MFAANPSGKGRSLVLKRVAYPFRFCQEVGNEEEGGGPREGTASDYIYPLRLGLYNMKQKLANSTGGVVSSLL